jgi:hypothetical protein
MGVDTEDSLTAMPKPLTKPRGWLREQQEAIRARGKPPFEFTPVHIKGESLTQTVIRERRGDFDDQDDAVSR